MYSWYFPCGYKDQGGWGFPSGAGVEVAETMVMHKDWNGEKLSLLIENVWNGLQER